MNDAAIPPEAAPGTNSPVAFDTALPRCVFVAGEASGDLLAAYVLPALRTILSDAEHGVSPQFAGIGGDRMIAAGFDAWWHVRELSVRGYVEVLRHLPRLLQLRSALRRRTLAWPANVYIGVDAPDFNLGLQQQLRAQGLRTVQFVAPAVWAWRPGRIVKIARAIDHLLAVFPFEEPLFTKAGIRTTYVGHPLARVIPPVADAIAARARLGIDPNTPTIAVLPGSRPAEVAALGPPFCSTIAWLQRSERQMQVVIPAADDRLQQSLARMLETSGVDRSRVVLTLGRSHDALEAADAVLVAGGTATLEAMLFGRPMVIAYKLPRLTEWLTRRKALIPYFGLPNILCGEFVVPEFVQEDVQPEKLGPAIARFLDDAALSAQLRERFSAQHEALLRDTPGLVAEAIAAAVRDR